MNNRKSGTRYEELAKVYLTEQGYRILAANFRSRYAEVDLVAREGKYLVFVEVKQRSTSVMGTGAEAVDRRKQARICAAADYYRMRFHIAAFTPVRFDVVTIDCGRIRLIRNAFPYRERGIRW